MNKKLHPQVQYFCKHESGAAEIFVHMTPTQDAAVADRIASLKPIHQDDECFIASLTKEQIFELAELPWVTRIVTRAAARTEAACGGPMASLSLEGLEMINGKR